MLSLNRCAAAFSWAVAVAVMAIGLGQPDNRILVSHELAAIAGSGGPGGPPGPGCLINVPDAGCLRPLPCRNTPCENRMTIFSCGEPDPNDHPPEPNTASAKGSLATKCLYEPGLEGNPCVESCQSNATPSCWECNYCWWDGIKCLCDTRGAAHGGATSCF